MTDRFIGTGPFKLAENVVGDRVVVEANPGYWGPKPPAQKIVWQVIPDAGHARGGAPARRHRRDAEPADPARWPTSRATRSCAVYSELSSLTHVLLLDTKEPGPLRDKRVRQALAMAIDRPAIIKNLYVGRGRLLNGVAGPNVGNGMDPGPYPYDPGRREEAARGGRASERLRASAVAVDRAVDARRGDGAGHRGLLGQDRRQDEAPDARVGGIQQARGHLAVQGRVLLRVHQRDVGRVVHAPALQAVVHRVPLLRRHGRLPEDAAGVRLGLRPEASARSSPPPA